VFVAGIDNILHSVVDVVLVTYYYIFGAIVLRYSADPSLTLRGMIVICKVLKPTCVTTFSVEVSVVKIL
jgi:hypothetical protein